MRNLAKVKRNFVRRASHLLACANEARSKARAGESRREVDRLVSYVIIELETSIAYVARNSYLAGVLGGRTSSGALMAPHPGKSEHGALVDACVAIGKTNYPQLPGRDEPAWSSSSHVSTIASSVSPPNAQAIISAMGIFPDARKCVKSYRNFFAHRGPHTLKSASGDLASRYGMGIQSHPGVGLAIQGPPGGAPLLELWINNYIDVVDVMCQ